jgi:hypothetical protein
MLVDLYRRLPLESVKILLVLVPSFVTGLSANSAKPVTDRYSFGGVRTFPLIGLIGYGLLLLAKARSYPLFFFWRRGRLSDAALCCPSATLPDQSIGRVTVPISALTHVAAALVYREQFCHRDHAEGGQHAVAGN